MHNLNRKISALAPVEMKTTSNMTVGIVVASMMWIIGLDKLAAAAPVQSYSIDQTRYFPTPEVEQTELQTSIAEVSGFPSVAPDDAKTLLAYLQRAEGLLSLLQRHQAYLRLLRASRRYGESSCGGYWGAG